MVLHTVINAILAFRGIVYLSHCTTITHVHVLHINIHVIGEWTSLVVKAEARGQRCSH